MKKTIRHILIIGCCLQLASCYYDVQEELHPEILTQVCDTSNITYAGKVSNILRINCYGCHSLNTASGNITLDNYAGVKIVADNGKLAGSIDHLTGFLPMPQNLNQLSECDRSILKKWIQNGSTNN